MSRVFLSHSSRDKDFVRELYTRLTSDGVDCFFDAESIGWGSNWVKALERAIDECDFIVFVLSPDFCNSEWVEVERTSALTDAPSRWPDKVRPLLLRPCLELSTFPRFLRQIQAIDVSSTAEFERNYPRLCRDLGGEPRLAFESLDRSRVPPVQLLPQPHSVPYHSLGDRFIGRATELWALHDALHASPSSCHVISGTGGIGKTQLAIEYAHRFGPEYAGGVFWADADRGLNALIAQVSGAAGVQVDTKAGERVQLEQLWGRLAARAGACLVVLDNFPEDEKLREYLPNTGRIHTVVTTRRRDLAAYQVSRLSRLSTPDGVRLLNSGERRLGDEAAGLVERLGGLPLALELTKSYLNHRTDVSVAQVLADMDSAGEIGTLQEFAAEYRDELPSGHGVDVAQSFQMSWDLVPESAQPLLRAMADLAPVPVPRFLLRDILGLDGEGGVRDPLGRSLAELVRLSLVELDGSGDPVAHRLVLAFVRHRNRLDGVSLFEECRRAVELVMKPSDEHVPQRREAVLRHAETIAADIRLTAEQAITLDTWIGRHQRQMGRYTAAHSTYVRALRRAEASYAPGHPSISIRQSNLALVLQDLWQLEEARDLLRAVATVLRHLGQLEEARDLLRAALAANERSYAPGHPSIAVRKSNLAGVLQDLGQLEEARDLLRAALAADERSYAPGHPSIATSQSNLALVLQDLGQLEEARDLLRAALAANERSYAPGHPSIAIRQSNLALVLENLGQLEEARDLARAALASTEQHLPAGHPTIAARQSLLDRILRKLGDVGEASGASPT